MDIAHIATEGIDFMSKALYDLNFYRSVKRHNRIWKVWRLTVLDFN